MSSSPPHPALLDPGGEHVQFTVPIDGRPAACLASREFLQDHFGAGHDPASWLAAYQRHAQAINELAVTRYSLDHEVPIVLHSSTLI